MTVGPGAVSAARLLGPGGGELDLGQAPGVPTVVNLWGGMRLIANLGLVVVTLWGGYNVMVKTHLAAGIANYVVSYHRMQVYFAVAPDLLHHERTRRAGQYFRAKVLLQGFTAKWRDAERAAAPILSQHPANRPNRVVERFRVARSV